MSRARSLTIDSTNSFREEGTEDPFKDLKAKLNKTGKLEDGEKIIKISGKSALFQQKKIHSGFEGSVRLLLCDGRVQMEVKIQPMIEKEDIDVFLRSIDFDNLEQKLQM